MKSTFIVLFVLFMVTALTAQNNAYMPDGLIHRWVFDSAKSKDSVIPDLKGSADATISGPIRFSENPITEYLSLDGKETTIIISDNLGAVELPKSGITVEAWAQYTIPTSFGGFIGAFQDNGGYEKGWVLGYSGETLGFALSTEGTDDGDGMMTYVFANELYDIGKWHHVVGTYDGMVARLYVNGILKAETTEQSGDILYPDEGWFQIGAYRDKDEYFKQAGGIKEIAIYDRALEADEVTSQFEKYAALADLPSEQPDVEFGFVAKPYLQFATQDGITILWETTHATNAKVLIGTTSELEMDAVFNDDESTMHQLQVSGLQPGLKYFYKVISTSPDGKTLESDVSTFQTAVNSESAFSFAVFGDTQNNPEVWGKLADHAWNERPNFALHAGDVVGTGSNKYEWINEFLAPGHIFMSRYPVYTVLGNHEGDAPYYYKYMHNPSPEWYYTFTYGNAQFFMIDSNRPVEPGSEQYLMLEKDLAASTAVWKIAVFHHPPYNSDEDDYGNTYEGDTTWGDEDTRTLAPLFEQYGIDIVFNGHIHDYERTWPISNGKAAQDGIIYITTGGAGGGLENYSPVRSAFSAKYRRDHHFCMLFINGNTLQFQAIDQNRLLFDSFELQK